MTATWFFSCLKRMEDEQQPSTPLETVLLHEKTFMVSYFSIIKRASMFEQSN